MRRPTKKFKKDFEHCWDASSFLGVMFTNTIHHFQEIGLDSFLHDSKPTPRANKWKNTVLQVITPLMEAAKEMWKVKEISRGEILLDGLPTVANRRQTDLRQRQRDDWHPLVTKKVGSSKHVTETSQNIDTTSTIELLRNHPSKHTGIFPPIVVCQIYL